jgi:hypothetical protein
MLDATPLSPDPNLEQSVYIQPYYSTMRKAERRTKSTTIIIVTAGLGYTVRETSHEKEGLQSTYSGTLKP